MSVGPQHDGRARVDYIESVVRAQLARWERQGHPFAGGTPQALFDRERLLVQLQAADEAAVLAPLPRGAGRTRRMRRR